MKENESNFKIEESPPKQVLSKTTPYFNQNSPGINSPDLVQAASIKGKLQSLEVK